MVTKYPYLTTTNMVVVAALLIVCGVTAPYLMPPSAVKSYIWLTATVALAGVALLLFAVLFWSKNDRSN